MKADHLDKVILWQADRRFGSSGSSEVSGSSGVAVHSKQIDLERTTCCRWLRIGSKESRV